MEELDHDDRTAECQLPPSRGTSRPRAAAPILHQPCQDQTREGGHAGSRGSLMAALPGDDGDPAANPVHQPPSGRANQPRAAEQRAPPPSAAACTHAGRKTEGPLYGAAAPGGGGRTGLDAEQADAAEHLPQPSGPHPATLRETRPVTVYIYDDPAGKEILAVRLYVDNLNQSTSTSSFAASCQNRHLVSMLTKFCLTPAHCRRSLMQSATIRIGIQPTRRIPNS